MEEVQKQVSQDHGETRLLALHPRLHEVIAICAADLLCHELREAAAVRLRDQGKCTGGLESPDCALQATETIPFMGEHLGPAARSSDRSEAKHRNPGQSRVRTPRNWPEAPKNTGRSLGRERLEAFWAVGNPLRS